MIMQTNSKILYSLNEIKENGYQIKADIPEEKRCKFCNKILGVQGILNPFDRSINLFIQNDKCDCIESSWNTYSWQRLIKCCYYRLCSRII